MALAHFVPTVGVGLRAGGTVVAYATDTGPHDALVELGRDADLYVVDATDRPGETERADRNLLDETDDSGRDWEVRLRRGRRTVVLQRGLGRFSATALAAEVQTLLAGTGRS